MHRSQSITILVLIACLMGGCVDLKPKADTTRYFVLGPVDPVAPTANASGGEGLVLGIKRIVLPSHLETQRLVIREGNSEIQFSNNYRWGTNLDRAITVALADYLVATPAVGQAQVMPWPDHANPNHVVDVRVHQFEGESAGNARLVATWMISDPQSGNLLQSGKTDHVVPGWTPGDYPDLVAKLDGALQVLASDLVTAISNL